MVRRGGYGLSVPIPLDDVLLHRLYGEEGLNDNEVAARLHVGRNRLREWRNANGVPSKTTKKGLHWSLCAVISRRLEDGETLTQIGASLGVNRVSLSRLMRREGWTFPRYRPQRPGWVEDYVLTPTQEQVLLGEMFGDGGLWSTSEHSAYYHCAHALDQEDFLSWKASMFSPLVSRRRRLSNGRAIYMATWSCPALKVWRDEFYPSGTGNKVLTATAAGRLTPLGLAVWYMGDGSLNRNTAVFHVGLGIDLEPIAETVSHLFALKMEARRYEREWHLRVMEPEKFWPVIEPWVLPSMRYKLPESYR